MGDPMSTIIYHDRRNRERKEALAEADRLRAQNKWLLDVCKTAVPTLRGVVGDLNRAVDQQHVVCSAPGLMVARVVDDLGAAIDAATETAEDVRP